ncbi:MAG: exonuclease domain-containing protein [Chitinophagaceae bacterium]
MYAIVDIETTGGHAAQHGITEICIILHNGQEVEGQFQTLINPQQHIPRFIVALTGITEYMVADAPLFADVADKIYNLLKGRIFVAHNVNFDYSFVNHHLLQHGLDLQSRKLCTVRYARKVKPGMPSYSLGKLCRHLDIELTDRHRAFGDAIATAKLLDLLLDADTDRKHFNQMVKGRNAEQYLPLHVSKDQLDNLPYCPGVYYFKNKQGKIVYVGKAVNLKYRVRSHFANNATNRRKQDMLREICSIEYKMCATELMALVLESIEIKRLWPQFNRSQKRFEQAYGLYTLEDQNGLIRLVVEKKRKHLPALHSFHRQEEGFGLARKVAAHAGIPEAHVFAFSPAPVLSSRERIFHNIKMKQAIDLMQEHLPTFAIVQEGADEKGQPLTVGYLVEKGKFVGMGFLKAGADVQIKENILIAITMFPDHDTTRGLLLNHATRYPGSVISW